MNGHEHQSRQKIVVQLNLVHVDRLRGATEYPGAYIEYPEALNTLEPRPI